MSQPILYVLATPIGNLGDITLRALEVLKSVDVIAAEDTRHTSGLLNHFAIKKKCIALHQHNEQQSAAQLIERLKNGETIALVSDAGTPAISDPGAIAVAAVRQAGFKVVPVPGPSAVVAALSGSGIASNGFTFIGFLPASNSQRKKALNDLTAHPYTLAFYEAPHRIVEVISDMRDVFGAQRVAVVARELTKTFETFFRGSLEDTLEWITSDTNQQRGEFVLLIEPAPIIATDALSDNALHVLKSLLAELPLKQAVKLAVALTGEKKNRLYEQALSMKND